jgi:predicted  nucleic acid-binding Zn-ribbon protein
MGNQTRGVEEGQVSVARQLYQLQLIDTESEEKDQRLASVNDRLGESGDVVRARAAVVETEQGLGQLRARLRALELEAAGLSEKLRKNQERLYGGRIRNPKELSSLQDEAAALRRRRSDLEDDQLELMIAIEEEEAELAERQARLLQIEATWRDEQSALGAEKVELEQRLAELAEQRDAMRVRIAAGDLANYDDLRLRLGGTGVAPLKQGVCQACGVDVPTSVARSVERGEGMHYCTICNRLLTRG